MISNSSDIRAAILEQFLADYPYSAQIRGGRPLRKGRWEQVFPAIETDPYIKDDFLSAAEELEKLGILSIKWARHRKGDLIEALYLKDPARLYQLLDLPSPERKREKSLELLADYSEGLSRGDVESEDGFVEDLIAQMQTRLEAFIPTPCSDPKDLEDLLTLLAVDRNIITELPLRALSIHLYSDSKRLEALLPQADKLTMSVSGEKLTDRFGLSRNYPQTALRGDVEVILQDGQVWKLGGELLIFGKELVDHFALIHAEAPILVVENKETFMTLPFAQCRFAGLIYGGGHLNSAAVKLLQLVEQSGIKMYYFGDLDPDGLLIFQQAENALNGELIPWHMDTATYLRYIKYGYKLSKGSLSRLSYLRSEYFTDLVELMRRHGQGIEQEVIDPISSDR